MYDNELDLEAILESLLEVYEGDGHGDNEAEMLAEDAAIVDDGEIRKSDQTEAVVKGGEYTSESMGKCPPGHKFVYVSSLDSGKLVNKTIIKITRKVLDKRSSYGHAAISFDKSLTHMYSFQIGKGWVTETIRDLHPGAVIGVFRIAVPNDIYEVMLDAAKNVGQTKEDYKYNIKGLLGFVAKKHPDKFKNKDQAMFCSQFVARLFVASGMPIFDTDDSKVAPFAFSTNRRFTKVYRGPVRDFDMAKIR